MKKIYGFAALAATMMLASCSNDDQPNVGNQDEVGTVGYLAVSIVGDGTRAPGETTDPKTDGSENKVTSATFVFYNQSAYVTHITVDDDDQNFEGSLDDQFNSGSGQVERISNKLLVVQGKGPLKPDNMIVVLNMPENVDPTNTAKADFLSLTQNFQSVFNEDGETVKTDLTSAGNFVMTNSVYKSSDDADGVTVDVVDISTKLKDTPSQATADPVNVWVERVVARADIDNNIGETNPAIKNDGSISYVKSDGTTVTVKPNITVTGVTFANRANESRLVKDIAWSAAPSVTWNELDAHRSHWAVSTASTFSQSSWSGTTDKTDRSVYLQENTGSSNYTSVLVTAKLTDADGNALSLVRMLSGGTYFLEDAAKEMIVNQFVGKYGYKDGNEVKSLPASFFVWKEGAQDHDYIGYLHTDDATGSAFKNANIQVKDGDSWKDATATDIAAINSKLAETANQALVWKDGACYYYKDIQNESGDKGIVRNHVYELTLSSIVGLGVPVVTPSKDIIPEPVDEDLITESEEWNLEAVINIVKWALVKQEVKFEN